MLVVVSVVGPPLRRKDAELVAKDIMNQYGLCNAVCKLSELTPCLHKLEQVHMDEIRRNLETTGKAVDPYKPNPSALSAFA